MNLIELNRSLVQLRLNEVIGEDVIVEYEGNYCTEDAVIWLRQKPRTIGELRSEEIDWLRWMAANTNNRDLLEKLSQDSDPDVRMWVSKPLDPERCLKQRTGCLLTLPSPLLTYSFAQTHL
jgi:hypothetical protein